MGASSLYVIIEPMTLTAHALAGASAAMLLRNNPVAAFFGAFAMHFVADVVPHWDYKIKSLKKNPDNYLENRIVFGKVFLRDLFFTGLDCSLGIVLSFFVISQIAPAYAPIAVLGAIGGVLPDFLQLVYHIFPRSPMVYLQKFHHWVQANNRFEKPPILGITSQIIFLALLGSLVFVSF